MHVFFRWKLRQATYQVVHGWRGDGKEGAFLEGTIFFFLLAESSCFNGLSKFVWKS